MKSFFTFKFNANLSINTKIKTILKQKRCNLNDPIKENIKNNKEIKNNLLVLLNLFNRKKIKTPEKNNLAKSIK